MSINDNHSSHGQKSERTPHFYFASKKVNKNSNLFIVHSYIEIHWIRQNPEFVQFYKSPSSTKLEVNIWYDHLYISCLFVFFLSRYVCLEPLLCWEMTPLPVKSSAWKIKIWKYMFSLIPSILTRPPTSQAERQAQTMTEPLPCKRRSPLSLCPYLSLFFLFPLSLWKAFSYFLSLENYWSRSL